MTVKQVYEATAIELSKVQSLTLKLYEFNYYVNQAILQYINKVYTIYDVNQQTTDDLRVLKSTATLLPKPIEPIGIKAIDYLRGATYEVNMPDDYLHLLNCVCLFDVTKNNKCWNSGNVMVVGATRLTADNWSSVIDDIYNRPSVKHPYYYIHNNNSINLDNLEEDKDQDGEFDKILSSDQSLPTNPTLDKLHVDNTKAEGDYSNFNRTFKFNGENQSAVEKPAAVRYANASPTRVEIRCGRDTSGTFNLSAVQIDYLKAPQHIRLTQNQLDCEEDISQIMEFPDYVNQEIINELVNLIMRKINDPSLATHAQITQSIARPTQQQAQ